MLSLSLFDGLFYIVLQSEMYPNGMLRDITRALAKVSVSLTSENKAAYFCVMLAQNETPHFELALLSC